MQSFNNDWLPHLKNAVPSTGYGNRLSMYLIALEAWRRGISVKFFLKENPENKMLIRYSLRYEDKEHFFESSRGDKLSKEADRICENKDETKQYLMKTGVPVPVGERFDKNAKDEEILKYAQELGYPVVLKPRSGNAGRGVFANIKDESSLKDIIIHVRNELGYEDVILEKHIPGVEYRILVVDGKVIGAVNRVPANIVGNGTNTIKELITLKNNSRKNNPNLSSKPIRIDKEVLDSIHSRGYTIDSILGNGEKLQLRNKSNISMGGDPIDVTDQLTDELKQIATKAVKAIPGLGVCGLDMIVDKKNNMGTVIEINTKPMLGLHLFPVEGEARDVVKPIVDYYFPETKNNKQTNLYFDLNAAIAPIRNRITSQVELESPILSKDLYGKKYIISLEDKYTSDYNKWIRLEALKKSLNGYVKKITSKKIEVVIAGTNKNEIDEFKKACLKGLKALTIKSLEEYNWNEPLKIGFEILGQTQEQINNKLKNKLDKERLKISKLKSKKQRLQKENQKMKNEFTQEIKTLEQKYEKLKQQNKKLKKQLDLIQEEHERIISAYDRVLQSRSWRYTKLFRKIFRYFN